MLRSDLESVILQDRMGSSVMVVVLCGWVQTEYVTHRSPNAVMLLWVVPTTKLRFDASVHWFHQELFFPKEESREMTSSSFFKSRSERGRISPCVGPSSMFINISGKHCKERGKAGVGKRFKGNYYHPAQWLPKSCCREQQLVCPSFLLLPFPTLFFCCLVKLLLSPLPL